MQAAIVASFCRTINSSAILQFSDFRFPPCNIVSQQYFDRWDFSQTPLDLSWPAYQSLSLTNRHRATQRDKQQQPSTISTRSNQLHLHVWTVGGESHTHTRKAYKLPTRVWLIKQAVRDSTDFLNKVFWITLELWITYPTAFFLWALSQTRMKRSTCMVATS